MAINLGEAIPLREHELCDGVSVLPLAKPLSAQKLYQCIYVKLVFHPSLNAR
jgi:hypothetical protein